MNLLKTMQRVMAMTYHGRMSLENPESAGGELFSMACPWIHQCSMGVCQFVFFDI